MPSVFEFETALAAALRDRIGGTHGRVSVREDALTKGLVCSYETHDLTGERVSFQQVVSRERLERASPADIAQLLADGFARVDPLEVEIERRIRALNGIGESERGTVARIDYAARFGRPRYFSSFYGTLERSESLWPSFRLEWPQKTLERPVRARKASPVVKRTLFDHILGEDSDPEPSRPVRPSEGFGAAWRKKVLI